MKKILIYSLTALMAFPIMAGSTKTTTTSTYEETTAMPESGAGVGSDSEVIEAEEYDQPLSSEEVEEMRIEEQQEMEARNQNSSTIIESDDEIDYSDRTRTNRARKALNTGSHASDDE